MYRDAYRQPDGLVSSVFHQLMIDVEGRLLPHCAQQLDSVCRDGPCLGDTVGQVREPRLAALRRRPRHCASDHGGEAPRRS